MPKVQLYEQVGLVIGRVIDLFAIFLEVGAVLLDAFKKEEELLRLYSTTIFCQF